MHDEYEPRRDRHGDQSRRDRHDDDDDYEPRRNRDDDNDDDYWPRRIRFDDPDDYPPERFRHRRERVPWYVTLMGAFMLGAAGLALLGHGFVFCVGFHAEFIRNAQPDPGGLIALGLLAAAILCSLVSLVAGYFMIVGRQYGLAITGCVAVALCTHFFLVGLVVGVISFVVLLQTEVRESFR